MFTINKQNQREDFKRKDATDCDIQPYHIKIPTTRQGDFVDQELDA